MPIYDYSALNYDGKRVRGKREAENEKELYKILRNEGLYVTWSTEIVTLGKRYRPIKLQALASLCKELGTMLESGMDILTVFLVLAEGAETKEMNIILLDIRQRLQTGESLSDALLQQGQAFPSIMVHMIRAGEANGQLAKSCILLGKQFDRENKIKRKVQTAMIYPSILGVVSVGVIIMIFTVVMPSFGDAFDDVELPFITKMMMSLSDFMITRWYVMLFGFVCICVWIWILFKSDNFRLRWAKFQVNVPKIKKFVRIVYTSRFARTLSALYSGGVNILTALELSASTINNKYLEQQIQKAAEHLSEGRSLSSVIAEVQGLDQKLYRSIAVGEESGRLDVILDNLSEDYDNDAAQAVDRMLALLEPILILVLGAIVMVIVISVLLPIYSMYNKY